MTMLLLEAAVIWASAEEFEKVVVDLVRCPPEAKILALDGPHLASRPVEGDDIDVAQMALRIENARLRKLSDSNPDLVSACTQTVRNAIV